MERVRVPTSHYSVKLLGQISECQGWHVEEEKSRGKINKDKVNYFRFTRFFQEFRFSTFSPQKSTISHPHRTDIREGKHGRSSHLLWETGWRREAQSMTKHFLVSVGDYRLLQLPVACLRFSCSSVTCHLSNTQEAQIQTLRQLCKRYTKISLLPHQIWSFTEQLFSFTLVCTSKKKSK